MPGEEVTVHVNRDEPGSIEAPDSLEARGPVALVVVNHGRPIHVHCAVGGDLASLSTVERPTVYVESETVVPVEVVPADLTEPVTGPLNVSTRYGAETSTIDLTLAPGPAPVDVDETLAEPPDPDPEDGTSDAAVVPVDVDPGTAAVLALAAVAVASSLLAASILGGALAVAAVLAVAVGLGAAGLFLYR